MGNWKQRFENYKADYPKRPDTSEIDKYRKVISSQLHSLYEYGYSNLLQSDEPKIIVKLAATPFQKSKFKENYTFAFQSLLSGRKSQFIPFAKRPGLSITDADKINGGVFPDLLEIQDNVKLVFDYYYTLIRRATTKQIEAYQEYQDKMIQFKEKYGSWWVLYNEYLSSPDWEAKRLERLDIDYNKCAKCGRYDNLQVHHYHYTNVGDEHMDDLVTVCHTCHQIIHGKTF